MSVIDSSARLISSVLGRVVMVVSKSLLHLPFGLGSQELSTSRGFNDPTELGQIPLSQKILLRDLLPPIANEKSGFYF